MTALGTVEPALQDVGGNPQGIWADHREGGVEAGHEGQKPCPGPGPKGYQSGSGGDCFKRRDVDVDVDAKVNPALPFHLTVTVGLVTAWVLD